MESYICGVSTLPFPKMRLQLSRGGPDSELHQCLAGGAGDGAPAMARVAALMVGHARSPGCWREFGLPVDLAQAPLWGLGRVIAQEHSTFWGGLVDLETGFSRHDAALQLWAGDLRSPAGKINSLSGRATGSSHDWLESPIAASRNCAAMAL